MNLLKAVLATALVATVISPWNAGGFDGTSAAPENGKEPIRLFEGLGLGEFDTYDLNESHAEFLEKIHSLGKASRVDQSFGTALSDSALLRQPNGDAWLIRVFYTPGDLSPWQGIVGLAKLRRIEVPQSKSAYFTIAEVVPVRIPKGWVALMEPFRATTTVDSERRSKLQSMLGDLDRSIQDLDFLEEYVRKQADSIRQYGPCCPGDSDGELSNEELAKKKERQADDIVVSRTKAIERRDKLRSVIESKASAR